MRRGWGLGGRAPPRKFMNFSSQNGVKWCVLGVLFLRLMCPMDCSCMIHFIEVPVCAKLEGVVNTGRPLQVKYWGGGRDPCNPCGVDAYAETTHSVKLQSHANSLRRD